jgi:hypothetical protein
MEPVSKAPQVMIASPPVYANAQARELRVDEQVPAVQRLLRYLDPFPVTLEQVRFSL